MKSLHSKNVMEDHNVPITYVDSVLALIAQRCTILERGARMLDAMITNMMLPEIGGFAFLANESK